jgi:hypothetical protein
MLVPLSSLTQVTLIDANYFTRKTRLSRATIMQGGAGAVLLYSKRPRYGLSATATALRVSVPQAFARPNREHSDWFIGRESRHRLIGCTVSLRFWASIQNLIGILGGAYPASRLRWRLDKLPNILLVKVIIYLTDLLFRLFDYTLKPSLRSLTFTRERLVPPFEGRV